MSLQIGKCYAQIIRIFCTFGALILLYGIHAALCEDVIYRTNVTHIRHKAMRIIPLKSEGTDPSIPSAPTLWLINNINNIAGFHL